MASLIAWVFGPDGSSVCFVSLCRNTDKHQLLTSETFFRNICFIMSSNLYFIFSYISPHAHWTPKCSVPKTRKEFLGQIWGIQWYGLHHKLFVLQAISLIRCLQLRFWHQVPYTRCPCHSLFSCLKRWIGNYDEPVGPLRDVQPNWSWGLLHHGHARAWVLPWPAWWKQASQALFPSPACHPHCLSYPCLPFLSISSLLYWNVELLGRSWD